MNQNSLFEHLAETAYSFYSTILLFGFSEYELEMLEECVNKMVTLDKIKIRKSKIQICDTDEITDIYAIPYFMAFVNFKNISEDDMMSIFEFFNEYEAPLPNEIIEEGYTEDDFGPSPIIYAINYEKVIYEKIPKCIKFNNLFENKEKLRLAMLSEIKDLEGVGVASTNSNRIYRVLKMYRYLVNEGILNKKTVDNLLYPDEVSERMFYKDMSIIRLIEDGNLKYDRKLKQYKLIKNNRR